MKKIICVFMSLMLLCSCSSKTELKVVNKGISYKTHIFYYGQEYDCYIKTSLDGDMVFTVTNGILAGFSVGFSDKGTTFSYMDKSTENPYPLMKNNLFSYLYEMNCYFDNAQYVVKEDNKSYNVTGKTGLGEFTLWVSPTGLPIGAQLDSSDFTVEFYDVTMEKDNK